MSLSVVWKLKRFDFKWSSLVKIFTRDPDNLKSKIISNFDEFSYKKRWKLLFVSQSQVRRISFEFIWRLCGFESINVCLNDKSLPKSLHPTFLLPHRWDKQQGRGNVKIKWKQIQTSSLKEIQNTNGGKQGGTAKCKSPKAKAAEIQYPLRHYSCPSICKTRKKLKFYKLSFPNVFQCYFALPIFL